MRLDNNYLLRRDSPISVEEAIKQLRIPISKNARSVQFLTYVGGLQDLERYIKYEIDHEHVELSINDLVSWSNRDPTLQDDYELRPLNPAEFVIPEDHLGGIEWWDLQSIRNGYSFRSNRSYGLQIWVDTDRSIVYVYQND